MLSFLPLLTKSPSPSPPLWWVNIRYLQNVSASVKMFKMFPLISWMQNTNTFLAARGKAGPVFLTWGSVMWGQNHSWCPCTCGDVGLWSVHPLCIFDLILRRLTRQTSASRCNRHQRWSTWKTRSFVLRNVTKLKVASVNVISCFVEARWAPPNRPRHNADEKFYMSYK